MGIGTLDGLRVSVGGTVVGEGSGGWIVGGLGVERVGSGEGSPGGRGTVGWVVGWLGVGLVGAGEGTSGEGMGVGLVVVELRMASWRRSTFVDCTGVLVVGLWVGVGGGVACSWMTGLSVAVVGLCGRKGWCVRGLGVQPKGMTGRAVLCRWRVVMTPLGRSTWGAPG